MRKPKEERRSLRQILATPRAKKVLRVAGRVLAVLAAVYLVVLALVVILQPADRAFTRPEEWLVIGLLALPALVILAVALVRILRRKKHGLKT